MIIYFYLQILQNIWDYFRFYQNYIEAILAIIIAIITSRQLTKIIRRRLHEKAPIHVIRNISKLVNYIIILIGMAIAIRQLEIPGVQFTELLIAGGFIGIVIGLAAQQTLSNFFSGILLIIERPFKIGDFINYNNNVGMVTDIGLLSTKVQSFEGFFIRIPNNELFNSPVINYSSSIARLVRVQFTVPFEIDIKKVIEILLNKFNQQWYILIDPPPVVFPVQFLENGIQMEARAWTAGKTWFQLYSSIASLIEETLKELGVPYSYPKRIISELK
jgi:Small-conductance mechanosensitive channel